MKKKSSQKQCKKSHLTRDDRIRIEEMLRRKDPIRSIAKELNKSPSTISREIKAHSKVQRAKANDCLNRNTCKKRNACGNEKCKRRCSTCKVCKKYCSDYTQALCEYLQTSPYVCNGCHKVSMCPYEKIIYKGSSADREYKETLINRRSGVDLTYGEIISIDEMVSPLIRKGQSPYHIKQTLGDQLSISESTLRRMIDRNELDVRNIDLRNQVKRKPRQSHTRKLHNEQVSFAKIGRHYSDYLAYIAENDVCTVQMDCVEGTKEDNATLLTLHFPEFHMQLAFIMDFHTAACVVHTLDMIEEALGKDLFAQMFPVIVTDNGHEFADIAGMERSIYGGKRTNVFFCEPNRSDQKGSCENNHRLIRYVIEKGTSLEPFMQADITLLMNHINSYKRNSLFGESPYSLAQKVIPSDFFVLLGLEVIPPEEIQLKPSLLKKPILSQ